MNRRDALLSSAAALTGGAALLRALQTSEKAAEAAPLDFAGAAVVVPNGATLPWKMVNGAKEFHLVAEPVKRELAPGMIINAWGYNGVTPGPIIECVEGDRVRVLLTNKLPERTSVHWHGLLLPNGMDGVAGLTQPHILPGETYAYEFTLRQQGTLMYHPHSDEMTQIAMGMMGFFIIHSRGESPHADRDFAIMLHEWFVPPGAATPNPAVMLEFNLFTFNSRVWPGTAPLIAKTGDRVRIRLGNLSMDNHPIHLHGFRFQVTGNEAGPVPAAARFLTTTVDVPPGTTRDLEFRADAPGDWSFHCHKSHHTMNAMSHGVPNMLGVNQRGVEDKVRRLLPGYMPMGDKGMGDMMDMGTPKNTLPMMSGKGPYGPIEMCGMFTVLKVRDALTNYDDPGWYKPPAGTVAHRVAL